MIAVNNLQTIGEMTVVVIFDNQYIVEYKLFEYSSVYFKKLWYDLILIDTRYFITLIIILSSHRSYSKCSQFAVLLKETPFI